MVYRYLLTDMMDPNLDAFLADCEARLEQDEEILEQTREQLHDLEELIRQLERAQGTAGGIDSGRLEQSLENARTQRRQTKTLLEKLKTRRAETQAWYDQLSQQLNQDSE